MSIRASLHLSQRPRSGLALGGLSAGWFELRHDGCFYNWNICNNTPWGTAASPGAMAEHALFFMVRYHEKGSEPRIKILQIPGRHDVASVPAQLFAFPWLTAIEEIDYEATFPFSRLTFRDREMPLEIRMEAFSPFIPHNVKDSALPAAIFNFTVKSLSSKPVDVKIAATMLNFAGHDVARKRYTGKVSEGSDFVALETSAELVDEAHDTFGTQVLLSMAKDSGYYLGWDHRHPFFENFIEQPGFQNTDDVAGRNYGKDAKTGEQLAAGKMKSTIGVRRTIKANGKLEHTFILAWHYPNLYAEKQKHEAKRRFEGHYYANHFANAAEVASYVKGNLASLTASTRGFQKNFFDSTAPAFLLEQVHSHLNTFFTSSWFTKAGDFGIQEGLTDDKNWGPLATIDVSMYAAVVIGALFPELDKAALRAHARIQEPSGEIAHGIIRNFNAPDRAEAVHSRLDLPSQFVLLVLRGYFWTGDREYLREMWPHIKKAIDFVLTVRDQNGDLLPDMGGAMCSYDNFPMWGTASYVSSLWLAALAHAKEAAAAAGDPEAGIRYGEILAKATPVFEEKLWNGKFYRLYNDKGGKRGDVDEGCLTDQIIGQWAMRLSGMGDLLSPKRMQKALEEIVKRNRRYWGLRNATWPGDTFIRPVAPENWGDQGNTCWTGTELCFASFLLFQGLTTPALEIVRNVDDRYRREGLYFDHHEFGGHYFRPMGSWAIINALAGFSLREGTVTIGPKLPGKAHKLFLATPTATLQLVWKVKGKALEVDLRVLTGEFHATAISLDGIPAKPKTLAVSSGARAVPVELMIATEKSAMVSFKEQISVVAGKTLQIRVK